MNSYELRIALEERVKELTFGYVPNDDDRHQMMWNNAILIIQRNPDNLRWHRVCVHKDKISVELLRFLVSQRWRLDHGNAAS